MDIIENIYLKNNFPGYETLYKLVKAENSIKFFLENQKEYELLKVKIKKKKKSGHITAAYYKHMAQMDIFFFYTPFSI
jgi:hypothetical protein